MSAFERETCEKDAHRTKTVYTETFMGSIKPKSFTGRGSLLDDSFVRNSKAWNEIGDDVQGEYLQYDIKAHNGREDDFRTDVNDRIKHRADAEQKRIWGLIHQALGLAISPSRQAVLVREPYRYKPQ